MRAGASALLILVGLSGCITPGPLHSSDTDTPSAAPREGPVVAVIDSGINPWHDAFALPGGHRPALDVPYTTIAQTFRDTLATEGLDAWNTLERETLYWFEGTRILAYSLTRLEPDVLPPDTHVVYDNVGHGTPVASIVARTSPNTWILAVEIHRANLTAFQWAAQQPWIDIISSSTGTVLGLSTNLTGIDRWGAAFRDAVQSGKLVVQALDNAPEPALFGRDGAPWIITVGGTEPRSRGMITMSSALPEVVAPFTWEGAARSTSDDGTFTAQGNSFAAPAVAGVLAEALHRLRVEHGHSGGIRDGALVHTPTAVLTNADFRRALNLSAAYWQPTEYEPHLPASTTSVEVLRSLTLPAAPDIDGTPVGPWVQMGWGYVDANTTHTIAELLAGRMPGPPKPDATRFMETQHEARTRLWELREG